MDAYAAKINWLFNQFPSFQKIGAKAYKPDLDNIKALLHLLGNPQKQLQFVHIAGTNGKGSTCHLLASIFQENGLKTGIFTSPHLKDFRERIRVNGKEIPQQNVLNFVDKMQQLPSHLTPSFFEISFALALTYFHEENCAICVIETGLGGRLDATNCIVPLLSIITNIGLDHQQFLGETRAEIAGEKAGIIKKNIPVLITEKDEETKLVFEQKANEMSSVLHWVDFSQSPAADLLGTYQKKNISTAYCAAMLLKEQLNLNDIAILSGIEHSQKNLRLRARMEIISTFPTVIIDAAHNEDGIIEVMKSIRDLHYAKLHILYGASSDKKIEAIIQHFPREASKYLSTFKSERSMSINQLITGTASLEGVKLYFTSPVEALERAKKEAKKEDLILICGSFFLIEEFL